MQINHYLKKKKNKKKKKKEVIGIAVWLWWDSGG
jgi:hypothetical protein